jgi:hypothetical protein
MTAEHHDMVPEEAADPFGERSALLVHKPLHLLGARVAFDSNSRELLRLVDAAYAGLPRHRLAAKAPDLHISLRLAGRRSAAGGSEPPPLELLHGATMLGGATGGSNFVTLSPGERSALVVIPARMLRFPYHTRYESIEFAVFTLAARVQRLVPLHAACVGLGGRGILLFGASGAGKSTVALHCILDGFDLLSEDSVFVAATTMLATGVPNFLHVRAESLRWLGRSPLAGAIRRSPVIRRRSGVRKFEVDLRSKPFRPARSPLKIVAAVFLSAQRAGAGPAMIRLSGAELSANLAATQAYCTALPRWPSFSKNLARLGVFELRRGRHPADTVTALRTLLSQHR